MEIKEMFIYMIFVVIIGCLMGAILRSWQTQNDFKLGIIVGTKFWFHYPYLLIKILINSDSKLKTMRYFSFNLVDNLIVYNYYCTDKYAIKQGLREILKEGKLSLEQIWEKRDLCRVYLELDIRKKVKFLIHDENYFSRI